MKPTMSRLAVFLLLASAALAQDTHPAFKETNHASLPSGLPDYKPAGPLNATIRSVGADTMEQLTKSWLTMFQKHYPGVKFTMEAKASGTAGPALTNGTADVGPVARELLPDEEAAFVKKFGYKPTAFRVATGSYRTPGKTHAITFFVHKDNPITKLSFAELDAIFSTTRKRGHAAATTWGDLGLKGEWAEKKISLWGLIRPNGIAHYVQENVLNGGEFKDGINERTTVGNLPALDAIVQGIEKDRYGIGYSGFSNVTPGVKAVALAADSKGPHYQGTFDEVVTHKYPLSRYVYIYVNQAPGKKLDPMVREYLSMILSKEGQEAVVQEGVFLPLPAEVVRAERAKLEQISGPVAAQAAPKKNWTAPDHKIFAQQLSDEIMAKHSELLSVTFHGVPPGMDKVYTMFAGSFPERIGNPDDPDDIDVQTKGITILDPRWHRTDPERKFVVLMPLRETSGENIGLIVFAFKNSENSGKAEKEYLAMSAEMRDGLKKRIPNYKSLFEPVR